MRMCEWKPENIRFSRDASEHSDYFRKVADLISGSLEPGIHVCDAGCGLGYLSLELTRKGMNVTAIDRSSQAMCFMEHDLLKRAALEGEQGVPAGRIQMITGDIEANPPQVPYDAMVFCTSRHLEDAVAIAHVQCKGKLIVIEKFRDGGDQGSKPEECSGKASVGMFEALHDIASSMGIPCDIQRLDLRFDQPFASLNDARLFFWMYRNKDFPFGIDDSELLDILDMTDDPAWPLRLPVMRHLGMIVMDMASGSNLYAGVLQDGLLNKLYTLS